MLMPNINKNAVRRPVIAMQENAAGNPKPTFANNAYTPKITWPQIAPPRWPKPSVTDIQVARTEVGKFSAV